MARGDMTDQMVRELALQHAMHLMSVRTAANLIPAMEGVAAVLAAAKAFEAYLRGDGDQPAPSLRAAA